MNCKQEFVDHTKGKTVLCAEVNKRKGYDDSFNEMYDSHLLPIGYSKAKYNAFLKSLDFEYDSEYGGQEIYGVIWYTDGTWSERGEYDGSEWWSYQSCPAIPDSLKSKTGESK